MSLVDVFVGNFPQIDWALYTLWVEGLSESEAMQNLKKRGLVSSQAEYCTDGAENILLASDVADNYRLFGLWESMLHQPVTFSEQLVFQLDPSTQHKLVEQYYALDNSVARELLGRKLTSRLRKDLDEIADKTGVSLRSCRRQFDNIKRVHRAVEEQQGVFLTNIKSQFLLPDTLAEKYSVLAFVACHRLETSKKKLAFLSFNDFSVVCKEVMLHWSPEGQHVDDSGEPLLDKDFFYTLRELKSLGEKEKEHRYAVCQSLGRQNLEKKAMSEIEANFKTLSKNILNIGQGIYSSREVREIFVNVVDKVVEPLRQWKLSPEEVSLLLMAYTGVVNEGTVQVEPLLNASFQRFMKTLTVIIVTFHRASLGRNSAG